MSSPDKLAGYHDPVTGSSEAAEAGAGAAEIPAAASPELKSLLALAVGTLVVAALYFGQDVLIPIMLAVMLSFVLSPLVNLLQKVGLWRGPAVIVTVLAALALLGLIGTLIGSQAAALTANAPGYARTIEAKIEGVQGFAVAKLAALTQQFGREPPPPAHVAPKPSRGNSANLPPAVPTVQQPTAPAPDDAPRPVPVEVVQGETSPFMIARAVLAPILGPLETTVIVLIVAIFVLLQKEDLRDRFIRVFGSSDLHRTTRAMDDAGERLSRYFISQLAVNTSFGIVIGIGLWLIGIPSPAMWGIMAGLLRFVPYIGAFLAAVAPAALGAAVDPGWTMAIEVIVLFVIVEPLVGYVVEPLLYGHSTGLSPVSVIVAAIFWTWLWGPIGLIMSTPLTLCLVVMGRHVKSLEFFDVLLGDRPALTPVESFYQRILADHPDEALAHAETLLASRSLVDYYDRVVLEGLKLSVEDQARGTIDRTRATVMARSMLSLIDELHEFAADQIAAPLVVGEVLCVAGHGPFDDAVTAMLVQLLGQRGVKARAVSNAAASREAIDSLEVRGVTAVAISYLELAGSPAHLRYLIKRLRARAPNARIIVGLWPESEAALTDAEVQSIVGADRCVGTLAGAIDAILTGKQVTEDARAA